MVLGMSCEASEAVPVLVIGKQDRSAYHLFNVQFKARPLPCIVALPAWTQ